MDYTFTNFVVGSSNQFAHAAALAVANLPAEAYNPLILYGSTGLGKTHLLHAVAHRIRQQHPTWRVVYLPAESFMRELLQDLQPPDLETRLAILDRKALVHGIVLPPGVAMLIAARVRTNVSDLEQCLARIVTYASLHTQSIDESLAEMVLQQAFAEREQAVTAPRIQQTVAAHFGLKMSDLRSKRRQRALVFPRQVAMYLCRELTDASLPEIGRHFGGRDHTTVLHACAKIARMEETDESVARLLWQLRRKLAPGCGKVE